MHNNAFSPSGFFYHALYFCIVLCRSFKKGFDLWKVAVRLYSFVNGLSVIDLILATYFGNIYKYFKYRNIFIFLWLLFQFKNYSLSYSREIKISFASSIVQQTRMCNLVIVWSNLYIMYFPKKYFLEFLNKILFVLYFISKYVIIDMCI